MAIPFLQIEESQKLLGEVLKSTKVEVRALLEARFREMSEAVILEAVEQAMEQISGRLHAYHDAQGLSDVLNLRINLTLKVD